MTELDPNKLRRELLLEQAINRQLDELVRQATEAVLVLDRMPKSKLEESQLRNLVNVASESASEQVVANFIRYQIARKSDDWGSGSNEFGHFVIADLYGDIEKLAREVLDNVCKELTAIAEKAVTEVESKQFRQEETKTRIEAIQSQLQEDKAVVKTMWDVAYARMMQLYLGYLNRTFYFYKKMKEKDSKRHQEAVKMLQEVVKQRQAEQQEICSDN